jgi:ligand-binding SRPBCC domain-containing protein
MHRFTLETVLDHPGDQVFAFFADAQNLEAITPPWLNFHIVTPQPIDLKAGAHIEYRLKLYGVALRWITVIESWNPPLEFVDRQLRGPYRVWHHTHRFMALPGGRTRMTDQVDYQLPFGPLGRLVETLWVGRDVARIFAYRSEVIARRFPPKG